MHAIQIFKILSNDAEPEVNEEIIDKKVFYSELAKSIKQTSFATAYREDMSKED